MIDDNQDGIIQTPGLDDYARAAQPDGALGAIAELVRRVLVCKAVVIRIVGDASANGTVVALGLGASAAAADTATLADPVAASDAGYQFYAGVPLRTASGRNLGVLAALGEAPRRLADAELEALKLAAGLAVEVIELREALGGAIAIAGRAAR